MDLHDKAESDFVTDFRDSYGHGMTTDLLGDFETEDELVRVDKTPTFNAEEAGSKLSELIDIRDSSLPEASSERSAEEPVTKSDPLGDGLSIGEVAGDRRGSDPENVSSSSVLSNPAFEIYSKSELQDSQGPVKHPEVDRSSPARSESPEKAASDPRETSAAPDHVNTQAAMEAAATGADTPAKSNDCCPFSPGVWFKPEKLHPAVADYVYWRDPKKTGVLFGSSLVLLLSLKFFSLISVIAYAILAVLSVTVSYRIYKNIIQSVKKSNEGHPFKEYLEMDIALSAEKLADSAEVVIHHINTAVNNLRSLILVEDLFDTLKLIAVAWCYTYIGAWFDGMTIVILAFVSAFTLPKLYETNQAQIDSYAELIHIKGKDLMETINSKIPLGKKKKNE